MPNVITEGRYAAQFLVSEASGNRSRGTGILLAGTNYVAGTVLGQIGVAPTATVTPGTNTGTGALTMDATTPVLAGAKVGSYVVTCIATATNSGTFRVEDPDGYVLGDVVVGATFADDIKFVIADGTPDFVVGDKFTIAVAAGSGKWRIYNPTATDGSQVPRAVLFDNVDATAADRRAAMIRRDAEVNGNILTWFAGATSNQKAAGAVLLEQAAGIIVRN